MAAQGQVRAVQLQQETGVHDGVVLPLHHLGQGIDVLLVRWVVHIVEEAGNLARGRRGHEDLLSFGACGCGPQVIDVRLHGRPVHPVDGAGAGWTRLEGRSEGFQQLGQFGELHVVSHAAQGHALPLVAGEPVLDVDGIVHPPLLAVVHHVQARFHLPAEHIPHGGADRVIQLGTFRQETLLLFHQQVQHVRRPGQAARVGGEDAVGALLHGCCPLRSRVVGENGMARVSEFCIEPRFGIGGQPNVQHRHSGENRNPGAFLP